MGWRRCEMRLLGRSAFHVDSAPRMCVRLLTGPPNHFGFILHSTIVKRSDNWRLSAVPPQHQHLQQQQRLSTAVAAASHNNNCNFQNSEILLYRCVRCACVCYILDCFVIFSFASCRFFFTSMYVYRIFVVVAVAVCYCWYRTRLGKIMMYVG